MAANERQVRRPGLLGMAVSTDCVYLTALHARANAIAGESINFLELHFLATDFRRLVQFVREADWPAARELIRVGAKQLQAAGADFLVVTSNTGSSLASEIADTLPLPLLDIAEVTCQAARTAGRKRLGLLSTKRTDASGSYHRVGARVGVEIISPPAEIADAIERVIFNELIFGKVTAAGIAEVQSATRWFATNGCDGIAFACTDLTHMTPQAQQFELPLFDSTVIHAQAAADCALGRAPW